MGPRRSGRGPPALLREVTGVGDAIGLRSQQSTPMLLSARRALVRIPLGRRGPRTRGSGTCVGSSGQLMGHPTEWLPVMTLPDGTTVEMPMPAPEGTGHGSVRGYRVRSSDGTTEFATLMEVLDHLESSGACGPEDPPGRP